MSNLVEQIHTKIKTITGTVLGSSYQLMQRPFSPEKNTARGAFKAYGVLCGSATSAETTLRSYTLDQNFEVLLQSTFVDRLDDTDKQVVINDLYDQSSKLFKEYFYKKLELPSIVYVVNNPSLSQPEIIENKTILLRVGITVKYRENIT